MGYLRELSVATFSCRTTTVRYGAWVRCPVTGHRSVPVQRTCPLVGGHRSRATWRWAPGGRPGAPGGGGGGRARRAPGGGGAHRRRGGRGRAARGPRGRGG